MESFEDDLSSLLECEGSTNLEAATVKKVISLLWKAPVLQAGALKVLTNACLQELQKQTQNTGYVTTKLVTDNISGLLDHQISSWATVVFEWAVALLTAVSRMKSKSDLSLETALKTWLGVSIIKVICEIVTRCLTNLLPDNVSSCVQSLIDLTKNETAHVRWIVFYVISQNPSLMVPCVIRVAANLHESSGNNSLAINLAHCLSHLSHFHRDTIKNCLTNHIMALFDLMDQLEVRRRFDFLFWLVKSDTTIFGLAASETLQQITVAKVQALLGVYYGIHKYNPPPKIVVETEPVSLSEDEGEVISSDEEVEGIPKETNPKPLTTSIKQDKPSTEKIINTSTDYTPVLVELMCNLGDDVAMVAVRLLIDCAQMMGIPSKENHNDEAMEEGEVDEETVTGKGCLNQAARALNLLLLRMQTVAFTHLYPAAKGTGSVAEEGIQFAAALQSRGAELCHMILQSKEGLIQCWLYQLLVYVGQISSEMHATQLLGYLFLKCNNNVKLSLVVNVFHEVSVVHSKLASSIVQYTIAQLLPETRGDLITLVGNILSIVQLPRSSAKQVQVRGYFLEGIKEHVQLLSDLLVENLTRGDESVEATGKLLLLVAATFEGILKNCQRSLPARISIANDILSCFFKLIKREGDRDVKHDRWLTSCSDVITAMLSRQQDGLENYVFSTLLKTALSHEMQNHFGATFKLPKASIVHSHHITTQSTLSLHNLNHLIHLLCCCCHVNSKNYLKISKTLMDQVAPSIVPEHVPWPTREHFKYYMEMNLGIKRQFDENPILWSVLQLLAEDSAAILWCSGLLCSLTCVLINHWMNMKNKSAQDTPTELNTSCTTAQIFAKAKWLHPTMMHISEVFHLLTPPEMFQLMNAIYNHVKFHLGANQDVASSEENLQQYTTALKTILRGHVVQLGALFARYYPRATEGKPLPS